MHYSLARIIIVFCLCIRTYELKVHGGTPFESGVDVDPARNMKGRVCVCVCVHPHTSQRNVSSLVFTASGGILPAVLRTNQTPRLYVRLLTTSRTKKTTYNLLPPTIVTSSLYTKPITYFRHMVGCSFLRGRLGLPLQS